MLDRKTLDWETLDGEMLDKKIKLCYSSFKNRNKEQLDMKNGHHNFRELNIWKNGMKIVKSTYQISKGLPNDEKFGLTSQIQRCSVSIPSNIAEGSGRSTEKDFIRFINIGLSSSYELETQLILVNDLYKLETDVLIEEINELQRMIIGFKRSLSSEN